MIRGFELSIVVIIFFLYQVFDDRKSELKRAANSDDDEIDRGRSKKVRYNNYNNKYHNGRNTNYNAFQVSALI